MRTCNHLAIVEGCDECALADLAAQDPERAPPRPRAPSPGRRVLRTGEASPCFVLGDDDSDSLGLTHVALVSPESARRLAVIDWATESDAELVEEIRSAARYWRNHADDLEERAHRATGEADRQRREDLVCGGQSARRREALYVAILGAHASSLPPNQEARET